jgi:kynureninase
MSYEATREHAVSRDRADGLAAFRSRFHLPPGKSRKLVIYLAGNSLGLQPTTVRALVDEELDDWARHGVAGHQDSRRPWLHYHEQLAQDTALLVGATADEVINMNTLTVNLHLMMVSFYRPTPERPCILIEAGAFPSDRYAVVSQLAYHRLIVRDTLLEVAPRSGEHCIRMEDLESLLEREGQRIALVLLPGVQYRTGQAFDLARITKLARAQGCRVGFDLAHSIGNLPHALHDWGPDFACWCNYKYLNGGPGAVGGCFVHARHANAADLPRFAGWWGHDKATRFLMGPNFKVLPGAEGWQISNPPILSMAPLIAALATFREAGLPRLREKSVALTGFLEFLLENRLRTEIEIVSPRNPAERGCQLSLRLRSGAARGKAVFDELGRRDVVCDWREPDHIRVAPVPLYNSFEEAWDFVDILAAALTTR